MTRFVYFAKKGNLIKIGCTSGGPRWRVNQIQGAELVGWIRGGFVRERAIHREFSQHSIGHEWFNDCSEIREYIAKHANVRKAESKEAA